ncbi:MAG: S8 family peptidase [Saprospiraceae bacterium]|nr:S8 family peptidase [Saprospiraceae bacterium]
MKLFVYILPLLFLPGRMTAQTLSFGEQNTAQERRHNELLVQLDAQASPALVLALLGEQAHGPVTIKKAIAPDWHIYLLAFDENRIDPAAFLAAVRRTQGVSLAQWNHRVPDRSTEPNDPEWWRQSDMTLIGAPDAWDVSTGGLTPNGDTIVVAVLEKGALLSHPDLEQNRWHNWAETPGNGIDDDNNGYIDDFGGWDARNNSDHNSTSNHGTMVNGVIGAVGNNETGVSGVNWNVRLMNISNTEFEAEIIDGYYYVGKMRRLYNETNGEKGAFVVATNASFGLDREKADDHPLWCATYDSLGQVGILGVGATANININVDLEGDMPTSCKSEFLITVNNTNKLGAKMPGTGFGSVSIDLGAPGEGTYSTGGTSSPTYTTLGGTSLATPHVTGAVGLLYSMSCDKLTSDALSNPAGCARRVRDILLDNVEPEPTLDGLTTTGGYLQIANSVDAVRSLCDGIVGPLEILEIRTSADQNEFTVYYQTPNFEPYRFRVFNMLGQQLYETSIQPLQFGINSVVFDASNLPRGVYVFSIGRGNVIKSRKFPKI